MAPKGPIRALIDASCLKREQGGIRSYTLGLSRSLAARDDMDITVATPFPDDLAGEGLVAVPIEAAVESPVKRALWRERRLPDLIRSHRADVVVIPLHEHPARPMSVPSVMVMHDLGPLVAPVLYGRMRWARYLLTLPAATRAATIVVSVSHSTYLDLRANVAIPESKCRVIGNGIQDLSATSSRAPAPAPIAGSYALYVGTLMDHKNIETVVRAFASDDGSLPERLVLAGPHTAEDLGRVAQWARAGGLAEERLVLLGYVPAPILAALYKHATVSVLPSLHEGFGIPVLEAMRLGLPVVVSDIPAHREVARDAALFVSEILSPVAWREAIAAASNDDTLRERLRIGGQERAHHYVWPRVAEEWAGLLHSLVEPAG